MKENTSLGTKIGGLLGNMAGKGLGKLFGFGEYKTGLAGELGVEESEIAEPNTTPEVNSLVQPLDTTSLVPLMHHDKEGSIRIVRREFVDIVRIQDIGTTLVFRINAGQNLTFPWLHSVARNFQEYMFLGLAAEYIPTSGYAVSGTNAALGQIAMAFQYNVVYEQVGDEWPITSLPGILNTNGATSCSPAAPGTCYMECDPALSAQPIRFVDNGTTMTAPNMFDFSIQNFDAAYLLIRTEGAQNATLFQAGQLWLTYEVVLMQPIPREPPPVVGSLGPYAKAIQEYYALTHYVGQMTDIEAILLVERIQVLRALFGTIRYKETMAHLKAKNRRLALRQSQQVPEISVLVKRIISAAEEKEPLPEADPLESATYPSLPPSVTSYGRQRASEDDWDAVSVGGKVVARTN